jgi:hypothetical protein
MAQREASKASKSATGLLFHEICTAAKQAAIACRLVQQKRDAPIPA